MYLTGFGNHHASEAMPGALPPNQNSPQHCPLGLFAEQLSGSAFTEPRHVNRHSWLYRVLPSVVQSKYTLYDLQLTQNPALLQTPNPMRWLPFNANTKQQDFVDGLFHLSSTSCLGAYLYQCNLSMTTRFFSNHDGEILFVPYKGRICLKTEFGVLEISPGMIAVIPRGIKFQVELLDNCAEGYCCENTAKPLSLPNLGAIGANGLANPRHFLYPTAAFEDCDKPTQLICKYRNQWWQASSNHSPLNVVAWHGNYAPYCYDLSLFNAINTVSFDHPDPSIFTVLTSESNTPGVANFDFVIFPDRWMVAEHTFRPPYFHRNIMSELMGLIKGEYDAKKEGFKVGGVSIHNAMTPHGPDVSSHQQAITQTLKPERYENTLAFMFESKEPWLVTEQALQHKAREVNYLDCWQGFNNKFKEKIG